MQHGLKYLKNKKEVVLANIYKTTTLYSSGQKLLVRDHQSSSPWRMFWCLTAQGGVWGIWWKWPIILTWCSTPLKLNVRWLDHMYRAIGHAKCNLVRIGRMSCYNHRINWVAAAQECSSTNVTTKTMTTCSYSRKKKNEKDNLMLTWEQLMAKTKTKKNKKILCLPESSWWHVSRRSYSTSESYAICVKNANCTIAKRNVYH